MKKLLHTLVGCVSVFSAVAQNAFTPGNLVVLQTSGTASKAASLVTLKEFTTSGAVGMSVTLPATGPTPFQSAGAFGGSEGFLTTSTDNKFLVLGGYATTTSPTDITGTASSAVPRAVGLVYPSGFYLQFDTSNVFYSGNDIRGAVSDGTNFWAAGASAASVDGIDFFGPGAHTAFATAATPPKAYGLRIFNGQIYYSTQKSGPSNSGSQLGIFALSPAMPTSGTATVSQVINTVSNTPEDFSFNATGDVCYVAINSNNAAGGIQKWTKSGSTWTLQYTLGTGIASTGAYGLAVDYSGTVPVIYATTADIAGNRVIKVVDNGTLGTAVITTLVSATANTFYKGITFAPNVSGTPIVNLSVSTDTASEAGVSVVTVTANTSIPVVGDQTVTLAVSGTGITNGDFTLSGTTITIPNGTTSGSVTFIVTDDILGEGTEVAALTISAPSTGLVLGMRPTVHVTITDNDGNNHPTIVLDTTTTNYIDTGTVAALPSPLKLSGAINDPTDPANTLGLNFRVNDLETVASGLTVWTASSNTTVLPVANLTLTGTGAIRNLKINPASVGYSNITVKVTDGTDTTSFVINYAASGASSTPANTHWHTGMSDASDAIAQNDNYYMSGDDELNVLNVYSRSASGMPLKSFNYTPFLSLPNPAQPEADIEAACVSTAHTNRVYWMGSMSNGKAPFDNKPNRDRLFATTYSGTGANTSFTFDGYVAIKTSLLAWGDANGYGFTASAAAGVDSKAPNGFAAEGMVMGPDNTTMYIGLRAPLVPTATRTKAVIAPIQNFETWFNNGAPAGDPTYGAPIELNLGGRGIRDMIRLSNGSYVIIAGSPGADMTSAIYKWTGYANDAPILVPSTANGVLNMEGVMQINKSGALSTTSLQVISDGGDADLYGDGGEAKDFADLILRKFRSDVVTGIDLTYPEINVQGNSVTITDGSTTTAATNNTDMGNAVFGHTTTKNFVIQNVGTSALSVSSVSFTGSTAADFTLVGAPSFPLSIAANGTYTLTVQFTASTLGTHGATMNIVSNDNDEANYDFAIRGTGVCDTPTLYAVTGGGSYCAGSTGVHVGLGGSSTAYSYQLFNGASSVATLAGTGAPLDFGLQTATGTYTIVATNPLSACTNNMLSSAVISVTPAVTPSVSVSGTSQTCAGTSVTFSSLPANGGSAPTYQWSINGTPVATTSGYTYTPVDGDVVSVKMTSNAACATVDTAVGTQTMTVNPYVMPMATIAAGPGSILCEGSPVTFTPAITNGGTAPVYTWLKNSAVVSTSATYSCIPTNGDEIVLSMTSNKPCRLATTVYSNNIIMTVEPHYIPVVTVTAFPSTSVIEGNTVTLTAHTTGAGPVPSYSWFKNGTVIAGATDSVYSSSTFLNNDSVSCVVTGSGACGTQSSGGVRLNVVILLGTPNLSTNSAFTVQPNPNGGDFFLKGNTADQQLTIAITNVLGQVILTENVKVENGAVNQRIVLSNTLPAGLYLLTVHGNSGSQTFRITVNR